MSNAPNDDEDYIPGTMKLLPTLPIGPAVRTVELVAKSLHDALDRDNDTALVGDWKFGESTIIDGRFNLTAVALRLMVSLALLSDKPIEHDQKHQNNV
jgi:hypothetical protein